MLAAGKSNGPPQSLLPHSTDASFAYHAPHFGCVRSPQGENLNNSIGTIATHPRKEQGPTVLGAWHGSNRSNREWYCLRGSSDFSEHRSSVLGLRSEVGSQVLTPNPQDLKAQPSMCSNRLFGSPSSRRHHHRRQATLRRHLLECRQIAALQIFPLRKQFPALPFQLFQLSLFGFGRR